MSVYGLPQTPKTCSFPTTLYEIPAALGLGPRLWGLGLEISESEVFCFFLGVKVQEDLVSRSIVGIASAMVFIWDLYMCLPHVFLPVQELRNSKYEVALKPSPLSAEP